MSEISPNPNNNNNSNPSENLSAQPNPNPPQNPDFNLPPPPASSDSEDFMTKVWTYTYPNGRSYTWSWEDRPKLVQILSAPRLSLKFNRPDSYGISGVKGSGKSALLVSIGAAYHMRGGSIIDAYAGNDNESLCWLLSPFKDNVVLVHGEGVEFKFHNEQYNTIAASDLNARELPSGKIFIISKMAFGPDAASETLYYDFLNKLSTDASHRDHWDTRRIDCWLIRESQEYIGSRLSSTISANSRAALEAFTRFFVQSLHSGWAIVFDRPRWVNVVKDVRELSNFEIIKRQGKLQQDRANRWWFKHVTPRFLRRMGPDTGLLVAESGTLAILKFRFPPWLWNTKNGFSITRKLGIEPVYDIEKIHTLLANLRQTSAPGAQRLITQDLHEEIVRRHIGTGSVVNPQGDSIVKLATEYSFNRSTVQQTWTAHVLGKCGCKQKETL
jgi:hypothetical protein